MSATAVEKITLQANEPRDATRGNLPPTKSHLLRWSSICSDRIRRRSDSPPRPNPKMALDAATRLRGHLLDPSVRQVGDVWRGFGPFISLSVDQSPLCSQEHRHFTGARPFAQSCYCLPFRQGRRRLRRCAQETSTSISAPRY